MRTRIVTAVALAACAALPSAAQWRPARARVVIDLEHSSDSEVAAWLRDRLDRGELIGDNLVAAAVYRSAVVVPLVQAKIEDVLRSSTPSSCFSDATVDPAGFLQFAPRLIEAAGDVTALKAASQLMKIDEARFGGMIRMALFSAEGYRNEFTVAYQGLALGDPAVDRRIAEWTESQLALNAKSTQQQWAEAMLDRYGVVPNNDQWRADPIASRLSAKTLNLVHDSVTRLAIATLEQRAKPK